MRTILCLVVFFLLSSVSLSFAETEDPTPSVPSEYQLPYPGLLPDHPFYFFRKFRDDLFGFLISSPIKKAEYNLLQADKQVEASVMLFNKKKVVLSEKILDQAIWHFEEAVKKTMEVQSQGMESNDLVKELSLANEKHQEVVTVLAKKDPKTFTDERKTLEELEKKVKALQPKK